MNISGSKVMTRNVRYTFGLCGKSYINHRGNLGVKKWPFLKRKFNLVSGKSSDLHKNWYKWSLGGYLKICRWDFWNFDFPMIYGHRKLSKSAKIAENRQNPWKSDILTIFGVHKSWKNQNFKNPNDKFLDTHPMIIYTNFCVNRMIF